jgi:serine/threonine-protein kinase HipA
MGRKAEIYNNGQLTGTLVKGDRDFYVFRYDDSYFEDENCYAISLTLPKAKQEYSSPVLFPFFYGLLSEGINKQTQCRLLRIDENDHFSLLLATAKSDTIGSITVKEIMS